MAFFRKNQEDDPKETYIMESSVYKDAPMDKSQMLQIGIISIMAVVLVVCVFILIDKNRNTSQTHAIAEPTATSEVALESTALPEETAPVYTYDAISQKNYTVLEKYNPYMSQYPELAGWIVIDGANVNYPVVQSRDYDNPHFYLDKGPDRRESNHGSIFLDTRNSIDELDRHTVIYGHNMNDGTMFGSLDKYKNKYFRNEHSTIIFDTIYAEYEWELINVFITTTEFYYIQTYFEDDEDFMNLMNTCVGLSLYKNDVIITPEDKILTLSTCTKDITDGRLVIQARLVEPDNDVEKN